MATVAHTNLPDAIEDARQQSIDIPDTAIYVIESKGEFYADDNGFIRTWETVHKVFENGKEVKNE
jgi:hypothetical protein